MIDWRERVKLYNDYLNGSWMVSMLYSMEE